MNKNTGMRLPHVSVGGIPVARAGHKELSSTMLEDIQQRRRGFLNRALMVFDSNAHAISYYATDDDFAETIDTADIIHADGKIVVWASKFLYGQFGVVERTATTDFFHSAAAAAAESEASFYLLGGIEKINYDCSKKLTDLYPGLKVAGRHHGYFDPSEEEAIIADINNSGADVLWVGLGKPLEQHFAKRVASKLDHCAWIVTCGGCFHFLVGDYPRAPVWMQKMGLEWLHRVATGPRYLFMRYLKTLPHALGIVVKKDLTKRIFNR